MAGDFPAPVWRVKRQSLAHMNNSYEIIERNPGAGDFNRLRAAVGWPTFHPNDVEVALSNSLFSACVLHKGVVIGMARVIGDGRLIFYVQDLIVDPEHQGRGIGSKLMSKALNYIRNAASGPCWVGLMANRSLDAFYGKFGFKARPTDKPGMELIF